MQLQILFFLNELGSFAGIISTLGFQYLTPFMNHKFLHDTCGVNNLHGMPGLM